MNAIKIKVGTMALTQARDVRVPQEYAGYDETVRVEPGTYDVFAYVEWTYDGGGYYRIHSLAARAEGTTTHAWYGHAERSAAMVGRRTEVSIELPTYGRCPRKLTGAKLSRAAVEIEEWEPESGGRMWRVNMRRDAKIEITKRGPWSGSTSEGVVVATAAAA